MAEIMYFDCTPVRLGWRKYLCLAHKRKKSRRDGSVRIVSLVSLVNQPFSAHVF